jgi:hypothetical protein
MNTSGYINVLIQGSIGFHLPLSSMYINPINYKGKESKLAHETNKEPKEDPTIP